MRVLHVYKSAKPNSVGGVETFIDTLCIAGGKIGIKNSVLTLNADGKTADIELNGYKVVQAKQNFSIASTGFSFSAFQKFKNLAKANDVIHYHYPNPFADLLHFSMSVKKPCLVTYHSDIVKQKYLNTVYRPLRESFLNSVDRIIATSPNYLQTSPVLKQYFNKTTVIPIGIDEKVILPSEQKRLSYWRKKLPNPFFLFVGELRYYKGLQFAIEAVAGTELQLVIAGSGKEEKRLKELVASLKTDKISFLGRVSEEDKFALIELCYGFLLPSHLRSEAFGIALLEAAALRKALISCDLGTGTNYVNLNLHTGLVVKPASAVDLRQAMQFLRDNPSVTNSLGMNARERQKHQFSAATMAQGYFEIYSHLTGKSKRG